MPSAAAAFLAAVSAAAAVDFLFVPLVLLLLMTFCVRSPKNMVGVQVRFTVFFRFVRVRVVVLIRSIVCFDVDVIDGGEWLMGG